MRVHRWHRGTHACAGGNGGSPARGRISFTTFRSGWCDMWPLSKRQRPHVAQRRRTYTRNHVSWPSHRWLDGHTGVRAGQHEYSRGAGGGQAQHTSQRRVEGPGHSASTRPVRLALQQRAVRQVWASSKTAATGLGFVLLSTATIRFKKPGNLHPGRCEMGGGVSIHGSRS